MLNKHHTAVLTLAILVTLGLTPKSVAYSDKVRYSSSKEDQLNTLKEDTSVSGSNLAINSEYIYSYANSSKETLLAQDVSAAPSSNETSTDNNQFIKFWWLAPVVVILVTFLGLFLRKAGSKPEQVNENQTTAQNLTDRVEVSSQTQQNVTSELDYDSTVTDKLTTSKQEPSFHGGVSSTQEDANLEEIKNISIETDKDFKVLEDIEERVENDNTNYSQPIKTQSSSYEQDLNLEDNQSLEKSSSPESLIKTEEIIDETLPQSISTLEAIDVDEVEANYAIPQQSNFDNKNIETSLIDNLTKSEEAESLKNGVSLTVPEQIAQSKPDLLAETEEINIAIASEQTEQIVEQDLANISEWLNEKIDSNNKDVSVIDDFWDDIASITEEINGEVKPEQTEQITDQDLANLSEWLNEKVDLDTNLSDIANNIADNLPDIVEDKDQDSNGELLDNSLNLHEDQNHNTKFKEGISDSTSNFLEELLNDDLSQERKH